VQVSETRYAQSGDVSIAYRVAGDGPFDLVFVPPAVSNVDLAFQDPGRAGFLECLASFSRLIVFDKRGTGLSDRVSGVPDIETRMDDVRAVMDAAGSARAAVIGVSEGGPMSLVFAATYPERTRALVLYGTLPRFTRAPGFPFGPTREESVRGDEHDIQRWGTVELARELAGADATDEEVAAAASRMRQGASPGAYRQLTQMNLEIDVRAALPSIRVPTLVAHRAVDHVPIDGARWMAAQIAGARFVEVPGWGHMIAQGDWRKLADEIEAFLVPICTGAESAEPEHDTVLATVLFTDIVDSTLRAAELGDHAWRGVLEQHHSVVRRELARFRGREHDTAGDGFFASFDGPARAIRCASAIRDALHEIDVDIRAGLHTGECELLEDKVSGIAVAIGARVAARAQSGEVLVSQTVKDLVAGSGLSFEERGAAELKGVPGEWRLYAVADAAA
jgi:pimeloyl-ACP methyl ester carboxylesterase/class 3 adenylate cyclase